MNGVKIMRLWGAAFLCKAPEKAIEIDVGEQRFGSRFFLNFQRPTHSLFNPAILRLKRRSQQSSCILKGSYFNTIRGSY